MGAIIVFPVGGLGRRPVFPEGLEAVAQRKLESPRPARAEEFPRSAERLVELGGRDVVEVARVIVVIEAANVGNVEEIENLSDELNVLFAGETPGLGKAQIKRVESVAELEVRIYMLERQPTRSCARRQRKCLGRVARKG